MPGKQLRLPVSTDPTWRLRLKVDPLRLVVVDSAGQRSVSVGGGEVFVDREFVEATLPTRAIRS
jgi:hypothetical protein